MSQTSAASEAEITYRGAVYPWHCDHVGHMNVMWYVGKFDEATWNLFHRVGITPAYLRASRVVGCVTGMPEAPAARSCRSDRDG